MLTKQHLYVLPHLVFLDCASVVAACGLSAAPAARLWGCAGEIPVPFAVPVFLASLYLLRKRLYGGLRTPEASALSAGAALLVPAAALGLFGLVRGAEDPYFFIIGMLSAATWAVQLLGRFALWRIIRRPSTGSNYLTHVLIFGTGNHARQAAHFFTRHPELCIRVTGFLTHDSAEAGSLIEGHRVLGMEHDLTSVLNEYVADAIFHAGEEDSSSLIPVLAARCRNQGIGFSHVAPPSFAPPEGSQCEALGNLMVASTFPIPGTPVAFFLKRCLDVFFSLAGIAALLPLWIMLPVFIKKDSPGPALFRQTRVGKNGRRFTMYKFRSMIRDADKMQEKLMHLNEMDGPVFKIHDDPRFTRLGKFLRQTSIDELPQLFNVLRGDMSVVGPRPPVQQEVARYLPWQRKRLSVIQGLTCLWQVTGRNKIKFNEWMQLDIQYIDHWSLLLDCKIILRTIAAVLLRTGI